MTIKIKRVYETPDESDGKRILVDRLWPRGFSKEKAHVDLWLKEVAPSNELRRWFAHDPARWTEFEDRYHKELSHNGQALAALKEAIGRGPATMLYGAKDESHNQAVVLLKLMQH
jgi:uncharacterized protein YeaO (DUF488 family)